MKTKNFLTALLLVLCAGTYLNVQAQDPADDANLDTQLYLIVGTNQDVDDAKLPASLDVVVKQLRATLPFKNYRLAATMINRVKNEGRLDLTWIGGPLAAPTGARVERSTVRESIGVILPLLPHAVAPRLC